MFVHFVGLHGKRLEAKQKVAGGGRCGSVRGGRVLQWRPGQRRLCAIDPAAGTLL